MESCLSSITWFWQWQRNHLMYSTNTKCSKDIKNNHFWKLNVAGGPSHVKAIDKLLLKDVKQMYWHDLYHWPIFGHHYNTYACNLCIIAIQYCMQIINCWYSWRYFDKIKHYKTTGGVIIPYYIAQLIIIEPIQYTTEKSKKENETHQGCVKHFNCWVHHEHKLPAWEASYSEWDKKLLLWMTRSWSQTETFVQVLLSTLYFTINKIPSELPLIKDILFFWGPTFQKTPDFYIWDEFWTYSVRTLLGWKLVDMLENIKIEIFARCWVHCSY